MTINKKECEVAGIDHQKIAAIARLLDRAAKQAEALGIVIFGGSGSGTLRFRDTESDGPLILAELDCNSSFDGGAGDEYYDSSGNCRGE